LTEQIRQEQRWNNIPILIVTARAIASDLQRIKQLGVDDYIIKPFAEEELLTIIPTLINRSRVRTELSSASAAVTNTIEDSSFPQQAEWLKELEEKIFQQLEQTDFSVDDLAASMHIGRTQFFLKVRKLTGLTPNQYIQEMRLQRARQLLEMKACSSVKKVVKIIGLKDERYFAKLFKQRFGKSPYDYL
jgi:YesN/AraC family two-component response regulator